MSKRFRVLACLLPCVLGLATIGSFGVATNLVQNPGFETVAAGRAEGWQPDAFVNKPEAVEFRVDPGGYSGSNCFTIVNKQPNDARITQAINIDPGKIYRVGFWVKTENLDAEPSGANFSFRNGIYYSDPIKNTQGRWMYWETYVQTRSNGPKTLDLWIRLGGFGSPCKGQVSFDDLVIEPVSAVPAAVRVQQCFSEAPAGNSLPPLGTSPGSAWLWIIGCIIVAVIGLMEVRFRRPKQSVQPAQGSDPQQAGVDAAKLDEDDDADI